MNTPIPGTLTNSGAVNVPPSTAEIIPFEAPKVKLITCCSFCGAERAAVKRMFGDPEHALICNICVNKAKKRLTNTGN